MSKTHYVWMLTRRSEVIVSNGFRVSLEGPEGLPPLLLYICCKIVAENRSAHAKKIDHCLLTKDQVYVVAVC